MARWLRANNVDILTALFIAIGPHIDKELNIDFAFSPSKVSESQPWDAPKWNYLWSQFLLEENVVI